MRVRVGILTIFCVAFILSLASCGGGGGSAALGLVPEGHYFSVNGRNLQQLRSSSMFEEYIDEIKWAEDNWEKLEDNAKDMGIDFEQYRMVMYFNSTRADEVLTYFGGPTDPDDFQDYCEDVMNWDDIEEEEANGKKYYLPDNNDQAFIMAAGGVFVGHENAVEDLIDVMTKGDDKLIGDKDYAAVANLVDMNATEFFLQWDNLDGKIAEFQGYVRAVDDDEDLLDAVKDLEAWSYSLKWGANLEAVLKFKFEDEDSAKELEKFLSKEMDEIFDKNGQAILRDFFRGEELDNVEDVEDLAEKADVRLAGKSRCALS